MPILKSIKKLFGEDKSNEESKKRSHERVLSNSHSYSPTASPTTRIVPPIIHKGAKKADHHSVKKNVFPSHIRHYTSPSSKHPPSHPHHTPQEDAPAVAMAMAKAQLNTQLADKNNPSEGVVPVYQELTMPANLTVTEEDDEEHARFSSLRRSSRSINFPLASLLSPNGDKHVRQDTDLFSPVTPQRSDTFHDQRFHLSMRGA